MSDQDTSIFNKPADQQSQDYQNMQPEELLKYVVDESGRQKYDTVQKALAAIPHANSHIQSLTQELQKQRELAAELEKKVAGADSVNDVISKLKAEMNQNQDGQPPVTQEPTVQGLDAESAEKLFTNLLSKREQEAASKQNINAVTEALNKKFGDKAEEVYKAKAKELGLSISDINSLSSTSPKAVLAYFGTSSQNTSVDVSSSTVNTSGHTHEQETTWGNHGKSILSGSTSRDVRAEAERNKALVAEVHAKGGTIEEMTDPKVYFQTFGKRNR